MHDLDRTLMEFETAADALEAGDYEREGVDTEGVNDEYDEAAEFGARNGGGESEYGGGSDREADGAYEVGDQEGAFDETQSMELAAELLESRDDQELEEFFGKLFKRVARAAGQLANSSIGKALVPVLTRVARTALPTIGAGLGNMILPGVGGVVGGKLASTAGQMFGLELEGMSPQDQELEVARRVVNLAGSAAQAALTNPTSAPPAIAARDAVLAAARVHAPGLAGGRPMRRRRYWYGGYGGRSGYGYGRPQSGRWVRRGSRIIILGL